MTDRVAVAVFPSAGSVHVWHAADDGIFASHGLQVQVTDVRSSDQQMSAWDSGELTVMHTSPDHLLRSRRRDPVAVEGEGLGDLTVYQRQRDPGQPMRWAVDNAGSAFALVLRAILEAKSIQYNEHDLVEVGATMQRLQALLAGSVDGATLHTPFDAVASATGCTPIGNHREVLPDFVPVVVVVERKTADSDLTRRYRAALADSRAQLLSGGVDVTAKALIRRGWDRQAAERGAETIIKPGGLVPLSDDLLEAIRTSVALRRRFNPGWSPEQDATRYVALH